MRNTIIHTLRLGVGGRVTLVAKRILFSAGRSLPAKYHVGVKYLISHLYLVVTDNCQGLSSLYTPRPSRVWLCLKKPVTCKH